MAGKSLTNRVDQFKQDASSCPLVAAAELIGGKWEFLIIRGALNGLKHFDEFQAALGIARNVLSDRLSKLVAGGILQRSVGIDPHDRRLVTYSLTQKGEDLLPVILALRQWGEKCGYGRMMFVPTDKRDGMPVRDIRVLSQDGRELELADLVWIRRGTDQDSKDEVGR
jgi:DNA-binding HxlR family transcriptional regulator